jgi:hypothetical protein
VKIFLAACRFAGFFPYGRGQPTWLFCGRDANMKYALALSALGALGLCVAAIPAEPPGHGVRSPSASEVAATQSLQGGEAMDANLQERINIGFAITPVPVNLDGKNPRQVGLGSYLVNAGGACNDCHTNPPFVDGGSPFMGQPAQVNAEHFLAGGKAFGPFVSRNITPDANTGLPGGRTYADFSQAMRDGHDFDCTPGGPVPGCPIMQVMPWPYHAQLSEADMQAIYAYLSAIPHADPAARPANGGRP